jgi:predicted ATPase
MGHVFLAEHVSLGRRAALKLLASTLAADEAFRARFVRESRLVAAIEHPNMIPIYDAGDIDGVLFIAMRYVEGHDLQALIDLEGHLTTEVALEIVGQAAAALDAAHAREIVHRDVKPANILIDEPSGRTFLSDFGVAKQADTEEPGSDLFVGTVDYASPEQIQGQPTGIATDVYALGCVLYVALTGKRPFPKDTDVAVVYGHILEPPPAVTATRPELPAALDLVIATALAKRESDRYLSCGELVAAAREALRTGATVIGLPAGASLELPSTRVERQRSVLPEAEGVLVGRERELAAATEALASDDVRLLTLTGTGGSGKTRLALEVAASVADAFPDGVVFVGLASLNDPALVLQAVAAALGIEEGRGDNLLETIRLELGSERILLVLDNFEHLLPAASIVTDLLDRAPLLKVLATSRSVLRVRGEREQAVSPLALPGPGDDLDVLARSAAVSLFVERAREVNAGFDLDAENAAAVVEICRRLDGLPLAIELAAARTKLLPPGALAARLENRLQLLTGGARDLPSRHQTLRGTIDWSYELLEPKARTLLARASVFVGGFTLDGAERVCASDELEAESIVEALSALTDEHLVRVHEGATGEPRFDMFETIREYALFRLIERGELDELRRSHTAYCVDLAEAAEPELVGRDQAAWARRLDDEAGNLRAALTWSLDGGELESGLRIAGALYRFWSIRGQLSEARRWLEQALRRDPGVPPAVLARATFAAGYSALGQGDFAEAGERFEQSLVLFRQVDGDDGVALCLVQLGWLATTRGALDRGAALSEEGLELAGRLGERRTASVALSNLGDVASATGDWSAASERYDEALALRRELGDARIVADSLLKAGRAHALQGDRARAIASLEEGLAIARELGDGWTTSVALASLGFVALGSGDVVGADELLGEALAWSWKRGDKRLGAECLGGRAAVAALRGRHALGAQLWGAADGLRDTIGASAGPVERVTIEQHLPLVQAALGEEATNGGLVAGRRLDFEQAVARGYEEAATET